MLVREILQQGKMKLSQSDTETPDLDASLLLAFVLGVSREKLYMSLADEIGTQHSEKFFTLITKRTSGEPVAWLTGKKEFWGIDITVGPGVLCPRADTEILVETALECMGIVESFPAVQPGREKNGRFSLHDCCTGPGTVAVALASEKPDWKISASDISGQAGLYFEKNNNSICNGSISFSKTDLMLNIREKFNIITANPPYLTPKEVTERKNQGWKEPSLALDGYGNDGLNIINKLIEQAHGHLFRGGYLIIEASPPQMPIISQKLAQNGFCNIFINRDLGGRKRVIGGEKS